MVALPRDASKQGGIRRARSGNGLCATSMPRSAGQDRVRTRSTAARSCIYALAKKNACTAAAVAARGRGEESEGPWEKRSSLWPGRNLSASGNDDPFAVLPLDRLDATKARN
jgi:hypothetical protein